MRSIKVSLTPAAGRVAALLALIVAAVTVLCLDGRPATAQESCQGMDPRQAYEKLRRTVTSLDSYTSTYKYSSERGEDHKIFSRRGTEGRYIRKPAHYCEKRTWVEASFREQAGAGYQECYTGADDLSRLLMPGPLRLLGLVPLYPEDPKASYLNGENLKTSAVWTWFDKWDLMLDGGRLEGRCEREGDKTYQVLTITRGRAPDPVYKHDRAVIRIDTDTWFPSKVEYFVKGDPRPVLSYEFEEVTLDPGLGEADMTFEGLIPKWNLINFPKAPELDSLAPGRADFSGLERMSSENYLARLDQALASVAEYRTTLQIKLSYGRLRQSREETFNYVRSQDSFYSQTVKVSSNYILLNAGAGFKMAYNPSLDPSIYIIPAGPFGDLGRQSFPPDDPRLFSAMGDNMTQLNFFAIREELGRRLENATPKMASESRYEELSGPWIEVSEPDLGVPRRPTSMGLFLDGESGLPRVLLYRGYDLDGAFLEVKFVDTEVKAGE